MDDLVKSYTEQAEAINYLIVSINAVLHVIFAGAVARDGGELVKTGQKTVLVSGITWAFATLIGGVVTAAIYWLIHHSKFTRN